MTGMAALRRQAETNPIAALAVKRIDAALEAMRPEIERLKEEWEREIMEGSSASPGGLSLLIDD